MKTTIPFQPKAAAPKAGELELSNRLAHRIQRRPVQSVLQAALAGYAVHYVPVRRLLSTALRLVVPGIFAAGVFYLSRQVPSSWERR